MSSESHALHRQQLFHWIGRHVEERRDKKELSREEASEQYVAMLRGSLARGLWVKGPESPEVLKLREESFSLRLPILCFTEWSLRDSSPHTSNYGRMGFGFPRRWVLDRGGQPVSYFRAAQKSPFLKAMFDLIVAHRAGSPSGKVHESLDYLLHFAKPVNDLVRKPAKDRTLPTARRIAPKARDAFRKNPGAPMKFVAEREWRIVRHTSRRFVPNTDGARPDCYLPYEPGRELFTLVLPDNYTVNRVMQDKELPKQLFPENGPHVTVISWQDIGTF